MQNVNLPAIAERFRFEGSLLNGAPHGRGHIHDTWELRLGDSEANAKRYILQRINRTVFREPERLMENLSLVTAHLTEKARSAGGDPSRETLTLVESDEGRTFHRDDSGDYWRAFHFIEGAHTHPRAIGPGHVYQAAKAFGRFLRMLSDLSPSELHETIPGFHHAPRRYAALMAAVDQDPHDRRQMALREINFAKERAREVSALTDRLESGALPLRITHNDTKISNVMIDDRSGEGICVIDLDTVMPGTALYDFGDLVRSACNTAAEDSQDLSAVTVDLDRFERCASGYLEASSELLTPLEVELLPLSVKWIAFELGLRFLTDYLEGDVYFRTSRPGQNLDRCRVQFKLVETVEIELDRMTEMVERAASSLPR